MSEVGRKEVVSVLAQVERMVRSEYWSFELGSSTLSKQESNSSLCLINQQLALFYEKDF